MNPSPSTLTRRALLAAALAASALPTAAQTAAGIRLLVREVPPAPPGELRNLADLMRARLGSGIVVLGAQGDGKVSLVAAASDDVRARLGAGRLLKEVALLVGGSGGGRDDFAQAGGKDPSRLDEALAMVYELVG